MNNSLHSLADKRNIFIGAAINTGLLEKDSLYQSVVKNEFNMVVAENAMKWNNLRPDKDTFLFEEADKLVTFAEENNMAVRGHTLVWAAKMPDWFNELSKSQMEENIENHIERVAGRYKGKIYAWDVVNEALTDEGVLDEKPLLEKIGPNYIEDSFRIARKVDPDSKLFWNEWGADSLNKRSDKFYELVKGLVEKGVPIDGVGFQMHTGLNRPETTTPLPEISSVRENFKRFADLGLEIHITEMDVQLQAGSGAWEERLQEEADFYGKMMRLALEFPKFKALLVWGVDDKHSWISTMLTENKDAPLLFDESYKPKLAYYSVQKVLEKS